MSGEPTLEERALAELADFKRQARRENAAFVTVWVLIAAAAAAALLSGCVPLPECPEPEPFEAGDEPGECSPTNGLLCIEAATGEPGVFDADVCPEGWLPPCGG